MAGVAGLLGLIGSAIVYTIGELPTVYKVLAWTDRIKVWAFETSTYPNYGVAISNIGDGPIILSHISLYYYGG
jgi:hypothetical protein